MEKIKRTFGFIFNHPLGKRHPVRALYRFMLWQLQSGLSPSKLIVKPFIASVKFYSRKGLTGISGNIYTGLHEFNDMAFLLHFLRQDDTFFDVGANAGSYTLLASGICGAKSVAIEPVNSTFDILTRNIALNNLQDKAKAINSGAGAEAGTITFSTGEDTTNHVIAADEVAADNVMSLPVISIDSLLINSTPALIKIDVEGYETEVLKGMAQTLEQPGLKALIIELNGAGGRYGFHDDDIHRLLLSKDFLPYHYDPFNRKLTLPGTYGNLNTIYCRDLPFVTERITTAKKIAIMGESI